MRRGQPGYKEHLAYKRDRAAAIRAGTWDPRKSLEPTVVATESDFEWSAGFLEGEGYFTRPASSLTVGANQRYTAEPLQRLLFLFGGSLRWSDRDRRWVWGAYGSRARDVMLALYPYLSKRRQRQINSVLTVGDVTYA